MGVIYGRAMSEEYFSLLCGMNELLLVGLRLIGHVFECCDVPNMLKSTCNVSIQYLRPFIICID
jgi:hypothetical protein